MGTWQHLVGWCRAAFTKVSGEMIFQTSRYLVKTHPVYLNVGVHSWDGIAKHAQQLECVFLVNGRIV